MADGSMLPKSQKPNQLDALYRGIANHSCADEPLIIHPRQEGARNNSLSATLPLPGDVDDDANKGIPEKDETRQRDDVAFVAVERSPKVFDERRGRWRWVVLHRLRRVYYKAI